MKKPGPTYNTSNAAGFHHSSMLAGTVVLLSSFVLYVMTLAPTVIWGDSASFALQVIDMHLFVGADAHPLFVILGRIFSYLPFEIAYSLNLLSAVTASLAVLMAYLIVFELTGSKGSAIVGAACLALSHAFWLHAVIAEVYDLNALFVLFIILLLLKWRKEPTNHSLLYLAAFLFGLGLSNHLVIALTGFGYLFFVVITNYRVFFKPKKLLLTIVSFLGGNSLFIFLSLKRLMMGTTTSRLMHTVTAGRFRKQMLVKSSAILKDVFMYFFYLFYQFPLVGFILGFIGIYSLLKIDRKTAIFLLIIIGVNMSFFISFGPGTLNTTKYTFYISDYAVFSIFVGYGFFSVLNHLKNKGYFLNRIYAVGIAAVVLLPLLFYNITPHASRVMEIDLLHARTIPYRDNETFFLNPNKRGYRGAARYAEEALKAASKESIIIADYTPWTVLKYFQEVNGVGKDILILDSGKFRENIPEKIVSTFYGKRNIYLADIEKRGYYKLVFLKDEYDFIPDGVLYKVVRKGAMSVGQAPL